MKTIEQLRQEAASYAIRNAGELLDHQDRISAICLVTTPGPAGYAGVSLRMATERALELAFLAGWQASRDGVR